MTTGRTVRVAAMLAGLACAGCVDRRFVIESNVPNAQVYIDDKPVGAAPAHTPFEYYGYYTVTLVHPGYETLTRRVHVRAPWYAYPPFDFLAEVVWPFHIRDTRRYSFDLCEATKTRTDDLILNADALRLRGQTLPSPERPALPKGRPAAPPQNQPQPTTPFPGGTPESLPPPAPALVPSVGPGGM